MPTKRKSIQEFSSLTKLKAFARARQKCERCGAQLDVDAKQKAVLPEFHHRLPAQEGGTAELENCQVLCYDCHKGSIEIFVELHPKSPPRALFVRGLSKRQRMLIAMKEKRAKQRSAYHRRIVNVFLDSGWVLTPSRQDDLFVLSATKHPTYLTVAAASYNKAVVQLALRALALRSTS